MILGQDMTIWIDIPVKKDLLNARRYKLQNELDWVNLELQKIKDEENLKMDLLAAEKGPEIVKALQNAGIDAWVRTYKCTYGHLGILMSIPEVVEETCEFSCNIELQARFFKDPIDFEMPTTSKSNRQLFTELSDLIDFLLELKTSGSLNL